MKKHNLPAKLSRIRFRHGKLVIPKSIELFSVTRKFRKVFGLFRSFYKEAKKARKENGDIPRDQLRYLMKSHVDGLIDMTGFKLRVHGKAEHHRPCIFVGNHVSYIDIPILASCAPIVFVAKREVKKWPIIGKAAALAGTVFVKRSSKKSRKKTLDGIEDCLCHRKQSIAVFPSGTTSLTEHIPWRWGAFEMAKELNVPVQPFRITYKPLRRAAYIDDDVFVAHLWMLLATKEVDITLEFGEPIHVKDPQKDAERLWKWSQEVFRKYPS